VETNIVNQDKETICVCSDRQINFIEGFTEVGYRPVSEGRQSGVGLCHQLFNINKLSSVF